MTVIRHWIARVRIGNAIGEREHVIRDEAEAELHRAAGWQVEGPFVPEPPQGAVEAIRKAPHARHCDAGSPMWPGPCTCWKREWALNLNPAAHAASLPARTAKQRVPAATQDTQDTGLPFSNCSQRALGRG
jgi:hypothetical protein